MELSQIFNNLFFFFCQRCRVGTAGEVPRVSGRTYQVEFGVPCLIGTSVPAVRVQQTAVGEVGGTTGGMVPGEPKRKAS